LNNIRSTNNYLSKSTISNISWEMYDMQLFFCGKDFFSNSLIEAHVGQDCVYLKELY
jgi:hypothetical protein